MHIIAIDPGTERSAVVVVDTKSSPPTVVSSAILDNHQLGNEIWQDNGDYCGGVPYDTNLVIEMIACYGQRVGREVFETCVWIGRFIELFQVKNVGKPADRLTRREVKMHLCNTNRANDADVRAALIDLYGPGKERAIGLKKSPGPLHGFKKDMWAALGVAVTYAKRLEVAPDEVDSSAWDYKGETQ